MDTMDYEPLYTQGTGRFDDAGYFRQSSAMLSDEAKSRLKESLDKVHGWPSVYMFKFIFEPEADRLEAVLALFPTESEVLRRYSAGGKYLSVTVKEVMMSADDVIARYDLAAAIPGVITL